MSQIGIIVFCILLGHLLRRFQALPSTTPEVINRWIVLVALPAICVQYGYTMPRADFRPAAMGWIVFFGAVVVAIAAGAMLRWDRARIGTVLFCSGLGNTAFIGYPVTEALYGKEALQTAIVGDQLGTILVLGTVGLALVAYYAGKWVSWKQLARRLLAFPPFVALLVTLLLRSLRLPPAMIAIAAKLGDTLGPLALVSVGWALQLNRAPIARVKTPLVIGLTYKLVVAPLIIYLVYRDLFGQQGTWVQVTVVEAAMPPALTTAIVVADQGLEADLAMLLVGLGLPFSILSILASAYLVR